ncbi:MAG: transcriptional repressor [Deltaproteobacteria bacterium]|nr:transcriptional repressor [Deltaproteobacteria bacterium]
MDTNYFQTLKELNLKATPKRLAILEIMALKPVYVSPEDVWQEMRMRFKTIGLPTVYRNLDELASGGVITKIINPDRQLYYFFCQKKHHHHHFICVFCHRIEELDFCAIREMETEFERKTGSKILSHIIQINGCCKKCRKGNP